MLAFWADRETGFWRQVRPDAEATALVHADLNARQPSLFLYELSGEQARILPKPRFYADGALEVDQGVLAIRARLYRRFLQRCLEGAALDRPLVLALDVSDAPAVSHAAPVFSFQKPRFAPNILMPDVDFFYYVYAVERDPVAPEDKRPGAVFAGASTGGLVTEDVVRHARLPRLALARALVRHPDIRFRIAAAVQCDTAETRAMLEAQPYFGPPIPWNEQLRSRFVISVDGNGATCSRVVRTLMSNSVLMKFNSPHQLFYFRGLRPYEHYLPVSSVGEMEAMLALDAAGRIDTAAMIARANAFAADFLTDQAITAYMRLLIDMAARDFR